MKLVLKNIYLKMSRTHKVPSSKNDAKQNRLKKIKNKSKSKTEEKRLVSQLIKELD